MQKELQERKIKIILKKLEAHMKNTFSMNQDDINRVSQLKEDELQQLFEIEQELEGDINSQLEELVPDQFTTPNILRLQSSSSSEAQVLDNLNMQISSSTAKRNKQAVVQAQQKDAQESLAFICNIFLKYLETLYALNHGSKNKDQVQSELRTMENLLLTQLKASFEQTKRIEEIIKQYVDYSKMSTARWVLRPFSKS